MVKSNTARVSSVRLVSTVHICKVTFHQQVEGEIGDLEPGLDSVGKQDSPPVSQALSAVHIV